MHVNTFYFSLFTLLGDGVFDKLTDEDVVETVWKSTKLKCDDLHQQSSIAVEDILKESLLRRSMDNVTAIMISLQGFQKAMFPNEPPSPVTKNTTVTKPMQEIIQPKAKYSSFGKGRINNAVQSFKKSMGFNLGMKYQDKSEITFVEGSGYNNLIDTNSLLVTDAMEN